VIEALVCAFFAFSMLQVRFHPSSSEVLASGSLDNEVRLWDATTAECVGSRDFCNITNLLIYISFVMKVFFFVLMSLRLSISRRLEELLVLCKPYGGQQRLCSVNFCVGKFLCEEIS
jgi:WD40 repeat protein